MNSKSNKLCIAIYVIAFVSGFVFGSLIQRNDDVRQLITQYAVVCINHRLNADGTSLFLSSFLANIVFLILILFINSFRIGPFLNFFLVLFYGLGKGALISNLVCDSGVYGLCHSAIILFPGMILASGTILFLSVFCFKDIKSQKGILYKLKLIASFIFMLIFSAGLDVTSAELYKTFL